MSAVIENTQYALWSLIISFIEDRLTKLGYHDRLERFQNSLRDITEKFHASKKPGYISYTVVSAHILIILAEEEAFLTGPAGLTTEELPIHPLLAPLVQS